jgi:ATP-dependent Clp protease ATP-binding subunit ClpC
MFEIFSESARRVVFWARREAGRSGSDFIEPEHLLQRLLAEDQRDWVRAMGSIDETVAMQNVAAPSRPFFSGEQAEKLRLMMAKSGSPAAPKPDEMDMPLTPSARRALEAAQEIAGSSTVTLLHLLLALSSVEQSSVCNLLKLSGITTEQIRDAIRNQP